MKKSFTLNRDKEGREYICRTNGYGYITISELIKHDKILPKRCNHCNGLVKTNWNNFDGLVDRLIEFNRCHSCDFWLTKPDILPHGIIINHYHYCDWSTRDESGNLVKDQQYRVQFNDGRILDVDRFTHQGQIPKRFYNLLHDNAKFIAFDYEHKQYNGSVVIKTIKTRQPHK